MDEPGLAMTPLERACRAAHDEHNGDPAARRDAADPAWDGWKSWLPVVRAVLSALREPSDAMAAAGEKLLHTDGGHSVDAGDLADAWSVMIDAALAERC